MYKKEIFRDLDKKHKSHLYTGLQGFFMKYGHKKLEDLVDISIYECEKYYPAFQQVLFDDMVPQESLKLSNFEIIGRA